MSRPCCESSSSWPSTHLHHCVILLLPLSFRAAAPCIACCHSAMTICECVCASLQWITSASSNHSSLVTASHHSRTHFLDWHRRGTESTKKEKEKGNKHKWQSSSCKNKIQLQPLFPFLSLSLFRHTELLLFPSPPGFRRQTPVRPSIYTHTVTHTHWHTSIVIWSRSNRFGRTLPKRTKTTCEHNISSHVIHVSHCFASIPFPCPSLHCPTGDCPYQAWCVMLSSDMP